MRTPSAHHEDGNPTVLRRGSEGAGRRMERSGTNVMKVFRLRLCAPPTAAQGRTGSAQAVREKTG
jgi:hypothetical protein